MMNKESEPSFFSTLLNNPFVIVGVGIVALGLLVFFGYQAVQPAKYTPSPGAGGRPKVDIPYMKPGAPPPPRT